MIGDYVTSPIRKCRIGILNGVNGSLGDAFLQWYVNVNNENFWSFTGDNVRESGCAVRCVSYAKRSERYKGLHEEKGGDSSELQKSDFVRNICRVIEGNDDGTVEQLYCSSRDGVFPMCDLVELRSTSWLQSNSDVFQWILEYLDILFGNITQLFKGI